MTGTWLFRVEVEKSSRNILEDLKKENTWIKRRGAGSYWSWRKIKKNCFPINYLLLYYEIIFVMIEWNIEIYSVQKLIGFVLLFNTRMNE